MSLNPLRRRSHSQPGKPGPDTFEPAALPATRSRPSLLAPAALGLGAMLAVVLVRALATRPPPDASPVRDFDIERYTGRWYEIARTDLRNEKGLVRTQISYSLNANGTLEVTNRGFDPEKNQWEEVVGKARFIGKRTEAALKVSSFGPFSSGYNVIALDPAYQWALVVGSTMDVVQILSRKPYLSDELRGMLLSKVCAMGVDEGQILWVQQDGVNPTGM